MTIEELNKREDGLFKFVHVGNEWRFENAIFAVHSAMVTPEELPLVDGAGTIFLFPDAWRLQSGYSESLAKKVKDKAYLTAEGEEQLTKLIQRPKEE